MHTGSSAEALIEAAKRLHLPQETLKLVSPHDETEEDSDSDTDSVYRYTVCVVDQLPEGTSFGPYKGVIATKCSKDSNLTIQLMSEESNWLKLLRSAMPGEDANAAITVSGAYYTQYDIVLILRYANNCFSNKFFCVIDEKIR